MSDNTKGSGANRPEAAQDSPAQASSRMDSKSMNQTAPDAINDGNDDELRPVSADMHQFIGRQLRAVFDDVAKQPIPDRFLELMKQLDDKAGAR